VFPYAAVGTKYVLVGCLAIMAGMIAFALVFPA